MQGTVFLCRSSVRYPALVLLEAIFFAQSALYNRILYMSGDANVSLADHQSLRTARRLAGAQETLVIWWRWTGRDYFYR
jgi:hypothetical protein